MIESSKLAALSTDQLLMLNKAVIEIVRQRRANETFKKARQFDVGQSVQFRTKNGRLVKMQVDRINTKSISGVELDQFGMRTKNTWRVHPSFLSATF